MEFVRGARAGVAATITPQHLLHNRNAIFRRRHPPALLLPADPQARGGPRRRCSQAATSGDPRFFLGTDSAPHERATKESACGCAGMFTAHAAIELYAEAFEAAGRLDRLQAFASHFGADFYGLPRHADTITLVRRAVAGAGDAMSSAAAAWCRIAPARSISWRLARPGLTP